MHKRSLTENVIKQKLIKPIDLLNHAVVIDEHVFPLHKHTIRIVNHHRNIQWRVPAHKAVAYKRSSEIIYNKTLHYHSNHSIALNQFPLINPICSNKRQQIEKPIAFHHNFISRNEFKNKSLVSSSYIHDLFSHYNLNQIAVHKATSTYESIRSCVCQNKCPIRQKLACHKSKIEEYDEDKMDVCKSFIKERCAISKQSPRYLNKKKLFTEGNLITTQCVQAKRTN